MNKLFNRIKNTVLADMNEILDKKENKNPIGLLNQYLKDCEKETEKVKQLVERQVKLKEEFQKELKQAEEIAEKRKQQAIIAEKAGEDDLKVFALAEQAHYENRAVRLRESLEITEKQQKELEIKYMEMAHKLKDMHIRRLELMGKENITRAHKTMEKVLDEKKMEEYTRSSFPDMEKFIETIEQNINTSYYKYTIDEKIAELENTLKKKEDSLSS